MGEGAKLAKDGEKNDKKTKKKNMEKAQINE